MKTAGNGDTTVAAPTPWEQQPGEPDLWYGRFLVYLQLGPARTLNAIYRKRANGKTQSASRAWTQSAQRWQWRERARAWDLQQRDLLAISQYNARVALHHRRVEVMEDCLERVRLALDNARFEEADQAQARKWLPDLRKFLCDLLEIERKEFERLELEPQKQDYDVLITADDLRAAQREMEAQDAQDAQTAQAVRALHAPVEPSPFVPKPMGQKPSHKDSTFLVCTGPDSEWLLGLEALRALRAAGGLRFQRLLNVTRPGLAKALQRQRSFGYPIEYLHIAVHVSTAGLELADGPADSNWLRRRLQGVRVLLLASCAAGALSGWSGVAPYVLTLRDDLPTADAAPLVQRFWQEIGLGREPEAALDTALAHCPPSVSDYVVRHC